jgi:protein-disulfide isomerase
MLKKLLLPSAVIASLAACQPPAAGGNKEMSERIEKLEKKVEALEKRPSGPAPQQPPAPQTAAYTIPSGDSPILGNKDAKLELTIFSDYQCPFCGRVDPMLHEVTKDPELKDKVKVVYKHFPLSFHPNAKPAAKAAMAAREVGGDKAFWTFSERAYQNQKDLTAENFVKWAEEAGVAKAKFEKALKDNDAKFEEAIKKDMDLGSGSAKVRGTPSLFLNGWELRQRSVDGVKQLMKEKNLG